MRDDQDMIINEQSSRAVRISLKSGIKILEIIDDEIVWVRELRSVSPRGFDPGRPAIIAKQFNIRNETIRCRF